MKFIKKPWADETVDLVCRTCPLHLMETEERMATLREGQVLEILTDYDGALEDIPAWCHRYGQEFMGMDESEDCYRLYIRKRTELTDENSIS